MSFITKDEASKMISNYETLRPLLLKDDYSTDILPLTLTVPKDEVIRMLEQPGAEFLKIYFAATSENLIDTVLFAADEEHNDIAPETDYLIIDKSTRVP